MDHRLLVARWDEAQRVGSLRQRLAKPGHVAVSEDAEAAAEEGPGHAVPLDFLDGQEAQECLAHRQADRRHRAARTLGRTMAAASSTAMATSPCSG